MISSAVKSMISNPIKSLIAATIVKTMLDICCSTIGVKAASRLAIRCGVLIPPVALIAAHISNMVAFSSNPKVIASCCWSIRAASTSMTNGRVMFTSRVPTKFDFSCYIYKDCSAV